MRIISLIVIAGMLFLASEAFGQTRATNQPMTSGTKNVELDESQQQQTQAPAVRQTVKLTTPARNLAPTQGSGIVREVKSVPVESGAKKVEDE